MEYFFMQVRTFINSYDVWELSGKHDKKYYIYIFVTYFGTLIGKE